MDAHTQAQCTVMLIGAAAFMAIFVARLRIMRLSAADIAAAVPISSLRGGVAALAYMILMVLWRFATVGRVGVFSHIDAFLLLGLLLTGMLFYFRRAQHLSSMALFILPMISGVLLLGSVLTLTSGRTFDYRSSWAELHILIVVVGSACFALGCVGGIVYLLADRQLRLRNRPGAERWLFLPPLASMEKFNQLMVALGFPMLTVACIMGFFHVSHWDSPLIIKTILAMTAWLVYAILLNIRRAPAFRGKRAAWLNIIGFLILLATYIAVNGMPAK